MTDPRIRQLAEAVHELARQKATRLPAWPDLSLSEREKAVAEARLWLRAAIEAELMPPVATDLHLIITRPGPGDWYGRLDVAEALEAAGWTGVDDGQPSTVRHPSGAVWAVTNESDDSGLDCPNGAVIEFPGDTPTVVVVAACLAAAATP